MKTRYINFILLTIVALFSSCTDSNKPTDQSVINFGHLKSAKGTDLIKMSKYIKLESLDESLLGSINQIEIYNDRIYILDRDKTNALYVFSIDGKFVMRLVGKGNGPGEFISPHSFWIDKDGSILILDRMQSRLLKYRLDNLAFLCEILLPCPSPLSFAKVAGEDEYIYSYSLRKDNPFENKLLIIADDKGKVRQKMYDASPANKILHGNSANFYLLNGRIRIYPNFSNKIYEIDDDSLHCCYNLSWEDHKMPDEKLFVKYDNSGDIMKEILTGDNEWIRLLYVYETESNLIVKYYIKKELYLSAWNKQTGEVANVKAEDVLNDLGIGNHFPLPIGVYNNQLVGVINPFEVGRKEVKDANLVKLLKDTQEESNPILVFYDFR